jgi:hypothetical protein
MKPHSPPTGKRWLWCALLALAMLLGGYVGSYAYLSRRGMAEARASGFPYFFYVPLREIGPDSPGENRHYRLLRLFDPINRIDQAWFGGGDPCRCVLWGLSR